jgi:hypothetical protein
MALMFSFGRADIREGTQLGCLLVQVSAGTVSILEECVAECNHKYSTTKLQLRLPSGLRASCRTELVIQGLIFPRSIVFAGPCCQYPRDIAPAPVISTPFEYIE